MDILQFLQLLKRKKQTILAVVVVCMAVAMLLVLAQPFKYGTSSRLLVGQQFTAGTDAYTISQSNDHLSKLLAKVVDSNSFYDQVMNSGHNIRSEYFTQDNTAREKMKKWNKTVQAGSLNTGNGIIEVKVFHPDKEQTKEIAQAVNYVLKTKDQQYHGLGEEVFLKIIDRPMVSERPVQPPVLIIFPAALAIALFLAGVYIYFFPEKKYDLVFIPQKKVEKKEGKKKNIFTFLQDGRKRIDSLLQNIFSYKSSLNKEKEQGRRSSSFHSRSQQDNSLEKNEEKKEGGGMSKEQMLYSNVVGSSQEEKEEQIESEAEAAEEPKEESGKEEQRSSASKKDERDIEEKGDMNNIFG